MTTSAMGFANYCGCASVSFATITAAAAGFVSDDMLLLAFDADF